MEYHLTGPEKAKLLLMKEKGFSHRECARRLHRGVDTVRRWWRRAKDGITLNKRTSTGRKKGTTEEEDAAIVSLAVDQPFMALEAIGQAVTACSRGRAPGDAITSLTVRRRLNEAGISTRTVPRESAVAAAPVEDVPAGTSSAVLKPGKPSIIVLRPERQGEPTPDRDLNPRIEDQQMAGQTVQIIAESSGDTDHDGGSVSKSEMIKMAKATILRCSTCSRKCSWEVRQTKESFFVTWKCKKCTKTERVLLFTENGQVSGDVKVLKEQYVSLKRKLNMLDTLRDEMETKSLSQAAREMDTPESTLRTWRSKEKKMLKSFRELKQVSHHLDGSFKWDERDEAQEKSAGDRCPTPGNVSEDNVEDTCDLDSDASSTTSEQPLETGNNMGTKQLEDDTCSLIMECTVEELSEVQLDCFMEARKAYQDAVIKANRLLVGAAPASVAPPSSRSRHVLSPTTGRVNSVESEDADRPSPPASPPSPPSPPPPASPPPPPASPSPPPPPPAPAPPQPPPQPLSLAEDGPFAISNLSSEIPPPARISLRRDLATAPATQLSLSPPPPAAPPSPPLVPLSPPSLPTWPAGKARKDSDGLAAAGPARPSRGGDVPVGALQPPKPSVEAAALVADQMAADLETREMQTQTHPALHVTVRTPYALTPANKVHYGARRSQLDQRVKKVLLNTASQFTEWLIQLRLVRATQFCPVHPVTFSGQPRPLRLGMFTDSDKLAQSGGYVWVKNCCRPKFLSVHYGSLFDSTRLQLPNTLPVQVLKLMYHWACQTPLHNVTQWLKVRPLLIDEIFGLLRAVCMLRTEETTNKLGGGGRVVQVGLVSLGTSGPDGLNKNVKVEVLGVKDETTGEIRMVGFEPRIKNRIRAVVSAVQDWVEAETSLLLDHSISPQPFRAHFKHVTNAAPASKDSNGNIMHYLRRSMPRMFQTSLVFLKPPVICQFIAEIAWREKYGRDPNTTFTNLIAHLGNLTQQCEGSLIDTLKKVLISPSMDLKRKPRKQTLATRPDSQPEFPGLLGLPAVSGLPTMAALSSVSTPTERSGARSGTSSPAPDQTSDGGGSESGASVSAAGSTSGSVTGSTRRRRGRASAQLSFGKARRKRTAAQPAHQSPVDDTRGCFFKLETLSDLKLPDLSELRCWECKLPLTHPKHITGVYACKRCRYSTSCEKIYPVHQRVFHSKGVAPVFTMGQPILLEAPMFCRCGFSTDSGNRLALHLSNCEKRTASTVPFKAGHLEAPAASAAAVDEDEDTPMEEDPDAEPKPEPEETVLDL